MYDFGSLIRKFRLHNKLPLRTVAAYLKIDQAILSKIERGLRKASRDQVIRLSDYFNAGKDELLTIWLSDVLSNELKDEPLALYAIRAAEEKIIFLKSKEINKRFIERKIRDYFRHDDRVKKVWIFGSFIKSVSNNFNDIDLLIEFDKNQTISLFDFADIKHRIENLLKIKIDLAEEDSLEPSIRQHVRSEMKLIYEKKSVGQTAC